MRLLEFLGTIRENASNEHGTFVGARLTRDSERDIMRWMRENGLRKKEPRARLHITVVGDKEQTFDWNPATFDPPLEIDPSSYKIEKFDDGAIVLSFSVPELEKRHEQAIKKYGIQWKYPTYQPHITLSYDPTELNNIERLLKPTFPMYVDSEYEQPWEFDESDNRSNRRRDTRIHESLLIERNVMNADQTTIWAKQMADTMFGTNLNAPHVGAEHGDTGTVEVVHNWAQKALRKYMINDVPAPQVLDFRANAEVYTGRPADDLVGKAKVAYPKGQYMFGILAGHTRDRNMTVPHWVPDALARGDELFWLDDRFVNSIQGSMQSVRDWFRHLARNEPEQLIPARLNRMSWEQAEQAAFAWHDDMKAKADEGGNELEGDKEIYIDLGKGIAWWKLTGESCLTREGDLMGHCVGDYLNDVQEDDVIILSLRDAKNQPHVTIELGRNYGEYKRGIIDLAQVKGKENKPPVEKYWKYVDDVIKKLDADGTKLSVTGEGHRDLNECGILELGNMLIRTDPPMEEVDSILNVVQYPHDREWSIYDHEEMPMWTAMNELSSRDMLPDDDDDNYGFGAGDNVQKINQYVKWVLLRDKEFDVDIRGHMDEAFFHDNPDFNRSMHIDREDEVPTHINIKVPDIKYEILSGSPEEFKFDIKHALATRGSLT